MRRVITGLGMLMTLGGAQAAESGWYLGLDSGSQQSLGRIEETGRSGAPSYSLQSGSLTGLRVGHDWGQGLRFEVNVRYREAESDMAVKSGSGPLDGQQYRLDAQVETLSMMAHALHDYPLSERWSLFASAGVGVIHNNVNGRLYLVTAGGWNGFKQGETTTLSWSLGGGVSRRLDRDWTLDAGWQYIDLGDAHSLIRTDGRRLVVDGYASHDLSLSLRYRF